MSNAMTRFEKKYIPEPMSGCWLWSAGLTGNGYGAFHFDGDTIGAHVASYHMHVGGLPPGGVVRHTCDTPSCVNPDHLVSGTRADNSADMVRRNRHHRSLNAHCDKGHEYTPDNTRLSKGYRECRICIRADRSRYRARRRARG